jgi:hypothetical protein
MAGNNKGNHTQCSDGDISQSGGEDRWELREGHERLHCVETLLRVRRVSNGRMRGKKRKRSRSIST